VVDYSKTKESAMSKKQKVTIYYSGIMGIRAIEAQLLEHGRCKYAQHDAAPFVKFIAKRKRKPARLCDGSSMNLLIVAGWNQPAPDSMFLTAEAGESPGVQVSRGRYSACDPRWASDFNEMIAARDVEIVADYRSSEIERSSAIAG
jgi:hypothetical protein